MLTVNMLKGLPFPNVIARMEAQIKNVMKDPAISEITRVREIRECSSLQDRFLRTCMALQKSG